VEHLYLSHIVLLNIKYDMTIIRRQFMRGTDPTNSTWVYLMLISLVYLYKYMSIYYKFYEY